MNPTVPTQAIDRLARRRTRRKIGWYIHAFVFIMVNAGLALLSAYSGRHLAFVAAFGWGLGLLIHGIAVFLLPSCGGLRERLVKQECERLVRQHDKP
ncbi:2TM domain-containing protein [Sulfuritalea sp.]|uniref:2TM domain-containing protein n=1 Tax=Sulfuritalea sp. TaxID=2480090 RepID=UPI00286D9792|nr:2TM domain-containing protein [Sulfuritalea sp.]